MMSRPADTREIPLFPLGSVLFPGGSLPLRIFETRYMDMVKGCLRDNLPFGVCLIAEGEEVGEPAVPYDLGTLATITAWDMPQLGLLNITASGEQRFMIQHRWIEPSGLQKALVEVLPAEASFPLPERFERLLPLIRRVLRELPQNAVAAPHRLDDAVWLAYRFCELLPVPPLSKQELLELDSCDERLDEIYRFCAERGLLET
jgi:hypothetical protein